MSPVVFSLENGSMKFDGERFLITDASTRKKRMLLAAVLSMVVLLISMNFLRIGDETGSPFHSVVGAVVLIMGIVYLIISLRGDYLKGTIDEIRIRDVVKVGIRNEGLYGYVGVRFYTQYEEHTEIKLKQEFRQLDILLGILEKNREDKGNLE